ncbi:MAG: thiamine pyrophosphate-binding protein [Hyphomicrobiaceae bacterium]
MKQESVRGRQVFMDSLMAHHVEFIFGNPGTTESPLLDSLISYPGLRYITALQESIALSAASYYAQASGKTGVVSLHVAPGLGNAIGMMYGALRADSPMIVTAGQQDTRMRLDRPVLGHDLVAMAAPVSKWSIQVERSDEMASIMRRAFKVAHDPPSGPVFVALPIDVLEQETLLSAATPTRLERLPIPTQSAVDEFADLILKAKSPAIVAGDDVARSGATHPLVNLTELIGASVWREGLAMQNSFPTDHQSARLGLPLDAEGIAESLAEYDLILLVGGAFFENVWHVKIDPLAGSKTILQVETSASRLAQSVRPKFGLVGDISLTLEMLHASISASLTSEYRSETSARNGALAERKAEERSKQQSRVERAWSREPLSVPRVMSEIRDALPDRTIVVDESISASLDVARTLTFRSEGDYYGAKGGGIGQGIAGALGIKLACPNRPVVCITGDGSAMYSIQALWTAAHVRLAIVFIVLANREYRILKHNIDVYRQRFSVASQAPYAHMDLTQPPLNFVEMASGMGVVARQISRAEDIGPQLSTAFTSGVPYLLEIQVEAKR